ncbi:MAG: hypothetical protein ACLRJV_14470 [Eubacteriales bacterium]
MKPTRMAVIWRLARCAWMPASAGTVRDLHAPNVLEGFDDLPRKSERLKELRPLGLPRANIW